MPSIAITPFTPSRAACRSAALLPLLLLLLAAAPLTAQRSPAPTRATTRAARPPSPARPIDWAAIDREAVRLLSEYVRINTTNPPGNELASARWLQRVLQENGIEALVLDTVELGAGRANLYARIRGDGSKRAIALVHHMDVVPADSARWTEPPYAGTVKDGWVWGRGTLDMKGQGIAHLMAMLAMKRGGVPMTRDIVFIGNADEELGSTGGIEFVRRHADLLADVEFLVTEGGENALTDRGAIEHYGVGVAEKRTFWHRLTVTGTPSHGSRPTTANPVPRLVAALDRIASYETPIHVTPGVAKFFRDIAPRYAEPQRRWLMDVERAVAADSLARAWILRDVYWNAILRNTISLTVLRGSSKTNVIPAEASAELDIRLLPDQDPAAVLRELQAIVNDTLVRWTPLLAPKTPFESPIDTDLFRAIERASRDRDPGALVTTPMFTAASDRPTYRALGITVYGVDPFKVPRAEMQRGMHGNDERLSVANLAFGVRYVYDVLRYVQ